MPELTLNRNDRRPVPMVCMYCGATATAKQEWRVVNHKPSKSGGGGGDLSVVPLGDDPISAAFGLLMLPFVLWELLKGIVSAIGAVVGFVTKPRSAAAPAPKPAAPVDPPTTLVAVTTCDRHRRFRDRFVWIGFVMAIGLVALWVWAIVVTRRVMGTENTDLAVTLVITAIFSTVLLPLALSIWYVFAGPVLVDRVTEKEVVLDRVRQPYFDATGTAPKE
ncbi:unnamed protein product [Gemmata massiliana]|uniref:Uncharacterized protein n=1 Tax=Gemmata massiliana TaxID=1210884 RepID=A0A6P2D612_9BACT|nr:hypothetical protein [Gemmata massiliana]VTR96741.1 unnamed protein product [Gemmata massiliana]